MPVSTAPQQSAQPFVAVETAIKPPIPIKDIVQSKPAEPQTKPQTEPQTKPQIEPQTELQLAELKPVDPQPADPLPPIAKEPPIEFDPLPQNKILVEEEPATMEDDDPDLPDSEIVEEEDSDEDDELSYSPQIEQTPQIDDSLIVQEQQKEEERIDLTTLSPFAKSWMTMCETVLLNVPALYHLFKLNIPQYENHIITVTVNNGIANAFFSDKKREILAYMRNNFAMEIEDIVLDIQTEAVQKKFLLSGREQAELLHEQNSELSDFMDLLELKLIE